MQITIDVPDYFVNLSGDQIKNDLLTNNALILFKQGKVSVSKAAKLANLDVFDFIRECKKNQIPVIDLPIEELAKELKDF